MTGFKPTFIGPKGPEYIGTNLLCGCDVVIEDDVWIGDNVKLGHRALLKKGTRLGNNVVFDDHCVCTGAAWVGDNVNFRTGAILAKANIIEDDCFIGPGVVTNHTKHVTHCRPNLPNEQLLTYIGYGSIIGSQASLLAGLNIGPQTIIGGGSVVVKSTEGYGVWVGAPCKRAMNLPDGYRLEEPDNVGNMYRTQEIFDHLKKFIPNLKV
jgi:acetyltransferase-like isoleucine patch superfamily enzyme